MSLPLRSLGFPEATDEEGAKRALTRLAGIASPQGGRELQATPFEGCTVSLHLDSGGEPESASWSLGTPRQPSLIHHVASGLGLAFTSLDGLPVSPFAFRTDGDIHPGLSMLDVCGVGLRAASGWHGDQPSTAPEGFLTRFQGYVLETGRQTNRLTGDAVALMTVWLPGLLLRAVSEGDEFLPGERINGSVELYGFVEGGFNVS